MTEPITISGHQIKLSEGREVWAGDHDNSWYIRFLSAEGAETKVRISYEAADALIKLLTQSPQQVWRYILKIEKDGKTEWAEVGDMVDSADTPETRV